MIGPRAKRGAKNSLAEDSGPLKYTTARTIGLKSGGGVAKPRIIPLLPSEESRS